MNKNNDSRSNVHMYTTADKKRGGGEKRTVSSIEYDNGPQVIGLN